MNIVSDSFVFFPLTPVGCGGTVLASVMIIGLVLVEQA